MKYNRFMGEYDDNTIYQAGDVVNFDGASYYRKVPGKGISPIARKKPYTVWSRLNEALSTIFPLGVPGGGGSGTGLPSDVGPYKQMATDGEGNWVPVDRLAWKEGETVTVKANINNEDGTGVVIVTRNGEVETTDFDPNNIYNEQYYRLFDEPLTDDVLKTISINGMSVTDEMWGQLVDGGLVNADFTYIEGAVVSVRKPNVNIEGVGLFPYVGTYFNVNMMMNFSITYGNGTIHTIPDNYISNRFVPTAIIKDAAFDSIVNGVGGAAGSYECINMTFEEAYEICKAGKPLAVHIMYVFDEVSGIVVQLPGQAQINAKMSNPRIELHFYDPQNNKSLSINWTSNGLLVQM